VGSTDWLAGNSSGSSSSSSSSSSDSWVLSWPQAGAGLPATDMFLQDSAACSISQLSHVSGAELALLVDLQAALEAEQESEALLGVCLDSVASLLVGGAHRVLVLLMGGGRGTGGRCCRGGVGTWCRCCRGGAPTHSLYACSLVLLV
jgi:hypothetical protein